MFAVPCNDKNPSYFASSLHVYQNQGLYDLSHEMKVNARINMHYTIFNSISYMSMKYELKKLTSFLKKAAIKWPRELARG